MNNHFERYFPWFVFGVGALYLMMAIFGPPAVCSPRTRPGC